jgi:hypothetical protein
MPDLTDAEHAALSQKRQARRPTAQNPKGRPRASDLDAAKEALGVIASRANSGKGGAHAVTYSLPTP